MAQEAMQDDENEDTLAHEHVQESALQKRRRRGRNISAAQRKRTTRSTIKAVTDEHDMDGNSNSDDEDEDDDPVFERVRNALFPSRDNDIVERNQERTPTSGVDNEMSPSRVTPIVDIARGRQVLDNVTFGAANGLSSNGMPPSRGRAIVDNQWNNSYGGIRHQVGADGVEIGVTPSRVTTLLDNQERTNHVGIQHMRGAESIDNRNIIMNEHGPGVRFQVRHVQQDAPQGVGRNRGTSTTSEGANGLLETWEWDRNNGRQGDGMDSEVILSPIQQERRALSYRSAKGLTKKNIRERIQVTLKTVIFRGVKFITCKEYFDKVMKVILDQEKPESAPQFVRMYKTIVMGALNTKRSTCEQSAQEVAMKLLKTKNHVDEVDPPPYSMETLSKLRQSQTEEEKEAFVWFAGELLECVCGKRAWGTRKKYRARMTDAKSTDTGAAVVTVSDEAFALLLYDAYIDKWIIRYHQDRRGEPHSKRIAGKYTQKNGTSTEYGGWSEEGIRRFNQLCEMVQDDRKSRNARDAEEWLKNTLREQAGGQSMMAADRVVDHAALQLTLERTDQPVVNAFIEL